MIKNSIFLFISLMLLPFAYLEIAGVRVLLLQTVFLTLFVLSQGIKIRSDLSRNVFLVYLLFSFILSLSSGNADESFGIFIFFILAYGYSFSHIEVGKLREFKSKSILIYCYSAVLCSLGVLFQFVLFNNFGIEFGKIDQYYQRTGFGFIWLDYSFLSLFLVSATPLVAFYFKGWVKYTFLMFLIVGSLATSARTGIFSAGLVAVSASAYYIIKSFASGRIKGYHLIFFLFLIVAIIVFPTVWTAVTDRSLSVSSSGRIDGFYSAINLVSDKVLFGFRFDIEKYKTLYGTIPHNLFVYVLTVSGLVGLVLVNIWILTTCYKFRSVDLSLRYSLFICFIGLQFIPTFYSAYFIAVLLLLSSISLEENRHEKSIASEQSL
jgi:O-antigen ligase